VARFDEDGNGELDDEEWESYEALADALIGDAFTFSGNLALVGALMLGLTHQITMGRPIPYEASAASAEFYGENAQWLTWVAYGCNCCSEAFAFFTLTLAMITRSCVTNVLPSRESKIAMLRMTNALGFQSVGMLLTLWCFVGSVLTGALIASPTMGFVGVGVWLILLMATMWFVAPVRFVSMILLHEEARRVLIPQNTYEQTQLPFIMESLGIRNTSPNSAGKRAMAGFPRCEVSPIKRGSGGSKAADDVTSPINVRAEHDEGFDVEAYKNV